MRFTEFVHLINPNKEKRRAVVRFFQEHKMLQSVFIERTSHPTHLETVVEWALNEGKRHVAVWGGDGTLHRVAQKLYEMNALGKMTLALVPVGTCNDFARALQIPAWKKYAPLALKSPGVEYSVDVGLLSYSASQGLRRRIFINNAGFGRDVSALSRHRSNPIRDILSFRAKKLDLDWMLKTSHSYEVRDVLLGVVCNGPYFNNGLSFDPRGSISDGVLDAFFEEPQSTVRLLGSFLAARFGRPLKSKRTFCISANELTVQSTQLLYPQADGEPIEMLGVNRLVFSILPKALRVAHWAK
jgi:diacylglycerol kinase family enzyme